MAALVALGGARAVSALRAGGSCITNPDAFASAQIAAGLRAVHQ
jgi:hypothetical protein